MGAVRTSRGRNHPLSIRIHAVRRVAAHHGKVHEVDADRSADIGPHEREQGVHDVGQRIQIFDFVKQEVTLVDPAHKTFAALPVSQFADKMAGAVPQATAEQMQAAQQAMASIKTNVDSKMTGKTAEIQGIQAKSERLPSPWTFPCRRR
jgi:hypothetical protein